MTVIPRIFCVFTIILCIGVSTGQADVGIVQSQEDQSAVWLRRVVRLTKPGPDSSTTLYLRGRCHSSVYVNGQRLARSIELSDDQVLAFDVTSLIRDGSNGIAVSAHQSAEGEPATVAVWVSHNGAAEALSTDRQWKRRETVPPVGWEQTDFNPHGWQDVVPVDSFSVQQTADMPVVITEWVRSAAPSGFGSPLSLTDGDHVVLLGSTFVERAQLYGHLEAMLYASAGATDVTFRNLGWSGDTIYADSRGIFDSPEQGFLRLVEHIRAEEPTVILVCYGQNEAMSDAGEAAVARFGQQLHRLHENLQTTGARMVLVSPHPLLFATPPIPSPNRFNPAIEEYALELQRVAKDLDIGFVDLFSDFPDALGHAQAMVQPDVAFSGSLLPESAAWTDNGMHWNEAGYRRMAILFAERCLQQDIATPFISIDPQQQTIEVRGGEIRATDWADDGSVKFEFRPTQLTMLPWEISVASRQLTEDVRRMTISSSSGAVSRLTGSNDSDSTLHFVGNRHPRYEQLRTLIVKKNELYFHRWRPQNITYLYGFRKHEQGNNAAEIAMFDPLVQELEEKIHSLREPQWETLRVIR